MSHVSSAIKRRRLAAWTAIVAVGVAVILVARQKNVILTEWYLHRLDSLHGEARQRTVERLGEFGSPRAAPRLVQLIVAEDFCAEPAVESLRKIGSAVPPSAVAPLVEQLSSDRPEVWERAYRILGELGPASTAALTELVDSEGSPGFRPRFLATVLLGGKGQDAPRAVPALIRALRDEGRVTRFHAVVSLGQHESAARDALPALRQAAERRDWIVWLAARTAEAQVEGREPLSAYENRRREREAKATKN